MKTLNMFHLLIYWTQKVHNDFIFLCSIVLPPVATLQTTSITIETSKTIELWFEFLSHFYVHLALPHTMDL